MNNYVPDRGDVVWLSLDPTLGNEKTKRRPVLVISRAEYNGSGLRLALICPITSSARGYPFQLALPPLPGVSGAIDADQIRSVDWQKRIPEKITQVSEEVVLEVVGLQLALLDPDGAFSGTPPDPSD